MAPDLYRRETDGGKKALTGGTITDPVSGHEGRGTLFIENGRIARIGAAAETVPDDTAVIDCAGQTIIPGIIDGRVFIGEPGSEHRETLKSVGRAAAAGGVAHIVIMPDTDPPIDDRALVDFIRRRARDECRVKVSVAAGATVGLKGEALSEYGLLQRSGAVTLSNGKIPISNSLMMRRALSYAKNFDMMVCHQPMDRQLEAGGVAHESVVSTHLGLPGSPAEAEVIMLDRDLRLVALTGGRYHCSQVSSALSVNAIRRAKDKGLPVTAAVSINHACLNENDIGPYRTFFRLQPPLRTEDDRQAIIEGLKDGTIDMIVSAHDPQNVEMKRHPFEDAADGAVGLETLFPAAMRFVHDGTLTIQDLTRLLSANPAKILGLEAGSFDAGMPADITVFDPDYPWIVTEESLHSRSKNTAFEDARMTGRVTKTFVSGHLVFDRDQPGG